MNTEAISESATDDDLAIGLYGDRRLIGTTNSI